jgi:hypothetical protein
LIRALIASAQKKITVLSRPRDQTGDPRDEQGTRKRNQDQPNAGEIGVIAPDLENHEPPTTTTATSNRYALTNQLPNRNPKTFIAVRSGG